jgi:hypothetical protein
MADNVDKFEGAHGVIKDTEAVNAVPMNFGGPAAQA